jgi:hypothetical protein
MRAGKRCGVVTRAAQGLVLGAGVALVAPAVHGASPETVAAPADAAVAVPSAAEVIARHVKATGGADAYRAIENFTATGVMRIEQMGLEAPMRMIWARAGDLRVTFEMPQMGAMEQGILGDIGWSNSMMEGPRLLEDAELEFTRQQADITRYLTPDEAFSAMTNAGIEAFNDEPAYRVDVVSNDGQAQTLWFSVETGYQIGMRTTVQTQMADIEATVTLSDYRPVGGILMSFRSEQALLGMTQTMEMREVSINAELDDDVFALPADVQALVDQADD